MGTFVDADAHVDECKETWAYFPKSMMDLRPSEMTFLPGQVPPFLEGPKRSGDPEEKLCLFIDGHIYKRLARSDELTQTTIDTRQLYDIPARIKDMDGLGVQTQVIYPSTLLAEVTQRPELEVAICESYNRWVADRCAESDGRLRWTAVLPLRSISDALREMRRVKDAGAVGIFKRAIEADDRSAGAEYFHPVYELAQELDLPICIHVSTRYTGHNSSASKTEPAMAGLAYITDAFLSIMSNRIPQKFPALRFAFIEAGCGWVPYTLWLSTSMDPGRLNSGIPAWRLGDRSVLRADLEAMLDDSRLFFSCEPIEDLSDVINRIGSKHLIVGTDYSHADRAAILRAHSEVMEQHDLGIEALTNLTSENARVLYALP
jgi:predicted TIM-barrel fold metal-dependent hydrolase